MALKILCFDMFDTISMMLRTAGMRRSKKRAGARVFWLIWYLSVSFILRDVSCLAERVGLQGAHYGGDRILLLECE